MAYHKILSIVGVVLVVKNLSANAGDVRDAGSIPGSGRSPGGKHDNPLQYSCLENPQGQRILVGFSLSHECMLLGFRLVTTKIWSDGH